MVYCCTNNTETGSKCENLNPHAVNIKAHNPSIEVTMKIANLEHRNLPKPLHRKPTNVSPSSCMGRPIKSGHSQATFRE